MCAWVERQRRRRSPYPSNLTDAQWAQIRPLLPPRDPARGGRPGYDRRLVIDTILYVLRAGCAWRMVPHDLAPWSVAYRWYPTWARDGTWDRVHDRLRERVRAQAGRDPQPSAAVLDAQSVNTAEGGAARGYDAGKKVTGRKRHLLVDTLGLLLVVWVSAASVQDRAGGRRVLARALGRLPLLGKVWWMVATPTRSTPAWWTGRRRRGRWRWRWWAALPGSEGLWRCPAGGWRSGRLRGWGGTAGWPRTTSASPSTARR
jgi:transposase